MFRYVFWGTIPIKIVNFVAFFQCKTLIIFTLKCANYGGICCSCFLLMFVIVCSSKYSNEM